MSFEVNKSNAHLPNLFSNRRGAVKGWTVKSNHNIAPWASRDNPRPAQKAGRKRRTKRRRKKRKRRKKSKRRKSSRHRRSRYNRRGRKRRSRRRTRRRQRGGGVYGFRPGGPPNWGKQGLNWQKISNGCGIPSKSGLGAAQQHAPLLQKGGGPDSTNANKPLVRAMESLMDMFNRKDWVK